MKPQRIIALALVAFVVILSSPLASAHKDGRVTEKQCYTDQYGTQCYTVWQSYDGHITRGHQKWTSADGNSTNSGWWRTNWLKGISFGQYIGQWFTSWSK